MRNNLTAATGKIGNSLANAVNAWQANVMPEKNARTARLIEMVAAANPPENVRRYLLESTERIDFTVNLLERLNIAGKKVCELGPGGLGLLCATEFGCKVDAYDLVEDFFKPIYTKYSIPFHHIDLNKSALVNGPYDVILFCEVFEHLMRWPIETLKELKQSLAPGGTLLISTQNLNRLSQRIRMVAGRPLFAKPVPEELIMGHLREYSATELADLLKTAGFREVQTSHSVFPDVRSPKVVQLGYRLLCKAVPDLSNFIFCWGTK